MDTRGSKERKVIETASATTSPDNENSGKFAYVVTGITIAALLLFALLGGIIMAAVAGIMVSSGAVGEITNNTGGPQNLFDLDDESFEDYLDQYYEDLLNDFDENGTDEKDEDKDEDKDEHAGGKSVSVSDALDFDLAPYLVSLNSEVPASSYAGTPQEVRDFVRQMMSTDTQNTDAVRAALNAAASDTENQQAHIEEARAACTAGRDALNALEVPVFENVEDGSVRDLLGEAKGEAARRFDLTEAEIALLATDGKVDTSRLWAADDKVVESCESAADKVLEAMSAASTN